MAIKKAHSRVDPELLRQLERGARTGTPVEAVFLLRRPQRHGSPSPGPDARQTSRDIILPEGVEALAERLLERAAEESGSRPRDVNVFRSLASFVVSADASFLRALMGQPEIASATANHRRTPIELLGNE